MLRVPSECLSSGTLTEETPYRNKRLQTYITMFRESTLASHNSRSAQAVLRSHASIENERRRQLRNYKYIIHPFSLFSHWWNNFMIFVILYSVVVTPFKAAFHVDRPGPSAWTAVKNIIIFICFCDIIINFKTGYFDKSHSIVELHKKEICIHYLKGYFATDMLGSVPTDIFFTWGAWNHYIVTRKVAALTSVFRIWSLMLYTNRLARYYDTKHALHLFFNTIFWIIIVLHWQACLFWIVPVAAVSMTVPQRPDNDSWINLLKIWELKSDFKKYGYCILRAMATFMHSGYLENTEPKTKEDQLLVAAFLFVNILITCFIIARFMQFFQGINSSKLEYQAAMAHLSQYTSYKQLPHITQNRIIDYYEFRFHGNLFRETEILGILSMHLREEIRMHSCRKLVENVNFFNNLPLSILSRIVALLKSEIFLASDIIVRANQVGDCMYFIASGTVAVYTMMGREVCHLEDGAHFGEIALVMSDAKRVASVVAIETCKLYKLERADFARTIHPYPMLWERIKKIARERHEKTTILDAQ